jgi:hypothetical protein
LVFKKNAIFFAKNWEKSNKIVIITSTPGHPAQQPKFRSELSSRVVPGRKVVCRNVAEPSRRLFAEGAKKLSWLSFLKEVN